MRNIIALLALSALVFVGCSKDDPLIPECVQEKMVVFERTQVCGDSATVNEFSYLNQRVFVLNPGICFSELGSEVINGECATLGYLGGLASNDTISGDDFIHAELVRTIWNN